VSTSSNWPHSFKQIDEKNWTESAITGLWPNMTEDIWVNSHLKSQLDANVPQDIAGLFEVARGTIIYGWFFYPLLSVGMGRCFVVLETAVRKRCEQLNIPLTKELKKGRTIDRSFAELLNDLKTQGVISASDCSRWDAGRELRNAVSHPERQTLVMPGMSLDILAITAELINALFKNVLKQALLEQNKEPNESAGECL